MRRTSNGWSQVGVFLSLSNSGYHNWIDGELYFPKKWFTAAYAAKRKRIGLPKERPFATKLELALQMTKRAYENGVSFCAIDFDSLYGRSGELRDAFDQEGFEYYGDVPSNTQVYLAPPQIFYPLTTRGVPTKNHEVIGVSYTVEQMQSHETITWEQITLRPNERGMLRAKFARFRVWTVRDDGSLRQEWLLIRQAKKKATYSLSNAAEDTALFTMAQRKSQRYFIERSNQDAKSEFGWDEFQAIIVINILLKLFNDNVFISGFHDMHNGTHDNSFPTQLGYFDAWNKGNGFSDSCFDWL